MRAAPADNATAQMTDLLRRARAGEPHASRQLFEMAYADLKRMAHQRLAGNGGRGELDTTSLVHESFVRLVERGQLQISDRASFFAYVARVMRSVVVDHVRAQHALKRGGNETIVTLTTGVENQAFDDKELLALNEALLVLERIAPELHELAELRYFAGLSVREIAEMRGTSTRTVEREWEKARAFLHKLMQEGASPRGALEETRRAHPGPRPR